MNKDNIQVTMPLSEFDYMRNRLEALEKIIHESFYIDQMYNSHNVMTADVRVRPEGISKFANYIYGADDLANADINFLIQGRFNAWTVVDFDSSDELDIRYPFENTED